MESAVELLVGRCDSRESVEGQVGAFPHEILAQERKLEVGEPRRPVAWASEGVTAVLARRPGCVRCWAGQHIRVGGHRGLLIRLRPWRGWRRCGVRR